MRIRLALIVSAAFAVLVPATASAVPGDPAISNPVPGVFRLNDRTLEPGCFVPGRSGVVDIDTHILVGPTSLSSEIHINVDDGAPFSIDEVLVPSTTDGYKVVDKFDTGSGVNDEDIDPGQTATGLTSGTAFVDPADVIVCVSENHGDVLQNEPYAQEAGGLVSAKNRPIITPKVVGFGESAIDPLNTYKIAWGYDTPQWYVRNPFETEIGNDNALFPSVTDPNAFPSPAFFTNLPGFDDLDPRVDGVFDAQRVNDVEDARGAFLFPIPAEGQNFLFRQGGDSTAWIDDGGVPGPGLGLLTVLTQGDLPVTWTTRASLASPDKKRTASFTPADFDAWEQGWQNYYCGKGPHPTLPLAPGTNSPDPRDCPVVINLPESLPAPTPSNPTPQVVTVPVPTPVVSPLSVNTTTAPTNSAIQHDTKVATTCHSSRVIHIVWSKMATGGTLLYRNKVVHAKRSNGRLRATADLRGMVGTPGAYMKVVQLTTYRGGIHRSYIRPFKVC